MNTLENLRNQELSNINFQKTWDYLMELAEIEYKTSKKVRKIITKSLYIPSIKGTFSCEIKDLTKEK